MSQELTRRLGEICGRHYTYDEVIGAAGNLLLNALRQKHLTLIAAQDELEQLQIDLQTALRRDHYNKEGLRRNNIHLPLSLVHGLIKQG